MTRDIESLIETRIERIERFGHESESRLKCACLTAAAVVGTYSGVTQEISKRTHRSVSTVENWAHAARLYKELRKSNIEVARRLWRSLPASHWWLAYDIQQAGFDALHYLKNADANVWSGRDMIEEYRRDREAGNAPMVFRRVVIALCGLVDELKQKFAKQITQEQSDALDALGKVFR